MTTPNPPDINAHIARFREAVRAIEARATRSDLLPPEQFMDNPQQDDDPDDECSPQLFARGMIFGLVITFLAGIVLVLSWALWHARPM